MSSFYQVITAAIADLSAHGYDSQDRVDMWALRIKEAARSAMTPAPTLRKALDRTFNSIYGNMIERGNILERHRGIPRFTLQKLKPKLRAELDRRIMASTNLITLNREASIEKTMQRFRGWATSVPVGGSRAVEKPEVKANLRKALTGLPFEERRVIIDQSHKFNNALSNILAVDGGAIALVWHSRWRQPGYDYREDHKERDRHVYLIRGSWAQSKGFVKPGPDGYSDQITQPAEEPFCRCTASYEYALRDLPSNMLTKKGAEQLQQVRNAIAAGQ